LGFFDFLKKKDDGNKKGSVPPPADKKVAGHAKVVADKRAQTYDRIEALQALAEIHTADSAAALLKRFSFSIDPSITDQEEKDLAFEGIVAAGRPGELPKDEKEREKAIIEAQERCDKVVEATRAYCERAEQLTWPIKVLRALLDDDELKRAVGLSLTLGGLAATAAVIVGSAAAVVLARFGAYPGSRLFAGMSTAPMVLPEVVIGLSLVLLFTHPLLPWLGGRGVLAIWTAHTTLSAPMSRCWCSRACWRWTARWKRPRSTSAARR